MRGRLLGRSPSSNRASCPIGRFRRLSLTALVFDLAHLDVVGVLAEVHRARHVVVDSAKEEGSICQAGVVFNIYMRKTENVET